MGLALEKGKPPQDSLSTAAAEYQPCGVRAVISRVQQLIQYISEVSHNDSLQDQFAIAEGDEKEGGRGCVWEGTDPQPPQPEHGQAVSGPQPQAHKHLCRRE